VPRLDSRTRVAALGLSNPDSRDFEGEFACSPRGLSSKYEFSTDMCSGVSCVGGAGKSDRPDIRDKFVSAVKKLERPPSDIRVPELDCCEITRGGARSELRELG